MHKSKGLEYPLVFIPFPWSCFRPRNPPPPLFHDAVDKSACLDLGSADQQRHREIESIERLAEDLRLFYVAVTRAAKLCVICWGRVKGAGRSAAAYLLHQDRDAAIPTSRMDSLHEAALRQELEALAYKAPGSLAVLDFPCLQGTRWAGSATDRRQLSAKPFRDKIDAGWRLASYSGLMYSMENEQPDYDRVALIEPPTEPATGEVDRVFKLPAGTRVGHFLHELLEQLDFPQARGEALATIVSGLLECYGGLGGRNEAVRQKTDWTPVVTELIGQVLDTPLDDDDSLRLRDIGIADRLVEMEFNFSLAGLTPAGLGSVLASSPAYAAAGNGLTFEPLRGLMRGFIDLVFRHRERYYIVDYKSNLLGNQLVAYQKEGLGKAIRAHRYDLQYLIYTVALHRFLGLRLPDYDYGRHFGGVFYLFLRGMRASHGNRYGVWYDRPEPGFVERLDGYFANSGEAA